MKFHLRIAALACAALWAFTCAVSAQIITFEFNLDVDQRNLGHADPGEHIVSDGFGLASVTLNMDTNELTWDVSFENLTSGLTLAHFHGPATIEQNAGVLVNMAPLGDAAGETQGILTGSAFVDVDTRDYILDHMTYINLHTGVHGGGEIRGQVVPEPRTYALIFGVIALGGAMLWRRRRARAIHSG